MLQDAVTEEIRRRADIVEVVGQYVSLRPAGPGRFKACCPFHDEKTPSFNVSRDKGFYKCFGCGVAGDVFKFVMGVENLSFPEARAALAERYGIPLPEKRELSPEQKAEYSERERLWKVMAAAAEFYREQFTGNAGLAARDYARSRGLSRATLEKFNLGYAPDAWDGLRTHLTRKLNLSEEDLLKGGLLIERRTDENSSTPEGPQSQRRCYDRYRHRLMFPIWDESGRVIAFGGRALPSGKTASSDAKYINSPEGVLFHKSRVLFAWHLARAEVGKRESIIITEGYMDAIALHEAGFANTVATLGTALTSHHVALLGRLSPKVIYLCFDGDSAGMKAALRTAPLFAQHSLPVRVVRLPTEHDPDTYVRELGAVELEARLREAVTLARYRMETLLAPWPDLPVEEQSRVMGEIAEIVNDTQDNIERDSYKTWLIDRLLAFEDLPTRREREVRRENFARIIERELAEDERRGGAQGRARDARLFDPERPAAPRENYKTEGNHGPRPVDEVPAAPALTSVPPTGRKFGKDDPNAAVRAEKKQYISALMMHVKASPAAPGVLKAQKHLLGALLAHPAWRGVILTGLPLEKWTDDTFGEIVSAVRALPEGEEVVPGPFTDGLSDAASNLVGEVMLSDEVASLPDARIVNDWIHVVNRHWSRQAELELREVVLGKMKRGEPVTDEERAAMAASQVASGRKQPVLPK